jgi:large subunit ribosomal protein L4
MPKVDLLNMKGEVVGDVELSENIFGATINESVLHEAVVNQLANKRQGTQSTKTISEVRGGGKKPWRQKGTGRARQGSIRSAQWVGGGVALGPKPRSYNYTLPKKVRRLALKSALSTKVLDGNMLVLDNIKFDEIKTKAMIDVLGNIKAEKSTLIVLSEKNEVVQKSARNIPGIKTVLVNTINVYDLLRYNNCVMTKEAVEKVEEVYA